MNVSQLKLRSEKFDNNNNKKKKNKKIKLRYFGWMTFMPKFEGNWSFDLKLLVRHTPSRARGHSAHEDIIITL